MARQKSKQSVSPVIPAILAVLLLVLIVGGGAYYFLTAKDAPEGGDELAQCMPGEVSAFLDHDANVRGAPQKINMFFDGSGGMAGYVSPQVTGANGANIIGDLITGTRNFTQGSLYNGDNGEIAFRSFGEKIGDPIADPESYAREAAYLCPKGGCDNQETRIDTLLRYINSERKKSGDAARSELNVIVTDLMLDNKDAVDSFEASVGGQLRIAVIEDNLAVGILGVKVDFAGNIYHAGGRYNAKVRRPLIIMMIGQPKHIRAYYDYLTSSEIPPFSKSRVEQGRLDFALFGQEPGTMQLLPPSVRGTGSGFRQTRVTNDDRLLALFGDLPQYEYGRSDAGDEDTGLAIRMKANATVADYEVIGDRVQRASAVWRLNADAADNAACARDALWNGVSALPESGWVVQDQNVGYLLSGDTIEKSAMRGSGIYLVQAVAGQTGLSVPHPAAAWMDDWSMSSEQITANLQNGAPAIGTPGLSRVKTILERELETQGRNSVPRSATHFILKVE